MTAFRLLADIGGTNIRFACSDSPGQLQHVNSYPTAEFSGFLDAYHHYRRKVHLEGSPSLVLIGAAGPIQDGRVNLTNIDWSVSQQEISENLDDVPVVLMNDLQAVAHALPYLAANDFQTIGDVQAANASAQRMLALNVGTGLGASVCIPTEQGWIAIPTEAGHLTLGAISDEENLLFQRIAPDGLSVEDILSGSGFLNLFNHIARMEGHEIPSLSALEIFEKSDELGTAKKAVNIFTRILGRFAGDLVLATGCWGGVYLVGGVLRGWQKQPLLDQSKSVFRDCFEKKGQMEPLMRSVYSGLVTERDIALKGLSHYSSVTS